ncbi:fluoride efflux transporter FluC [Nocardia sp. NBC_01329]|uniref:fluoride efflux transporter FluC n=1 Tax=Nocardia sp. NBC_01329 TaxID=2903594 RepID=UPI002E0EAE21|nr:CrcB family protein [Nocardia sp. NBC_01329]
MPDDPPPVHGPPLPVDPDIDLGYAPQRAELAGSHGAILAVIAIGGALGALARYGLIRSLPTPPGGFPWMVLLINVIGSFLLGALMVVITEQRSAHPLLRPFLGVGVLGGFTTFSTYADDIRALLDTGAVLIGAAYLASTLFAAVAACALGVGLARRLGGGAAR